MINNSQAVTVQGLDWKKIALLKKYPNLANNDMIKETKL